MLECIRVQHFTQGQDNSTILGVWRISATFYHRDLVMESSPRESFRVRTHRKLGPHLTPLHSFICSVGFDSFVIPRTVARPAPLSMQFSRQEQWKRVPFPPPGDLPHPGIKAASLPSQVDSLPQSHRRTPFLCLALSIEQIKLTNCNREPSLNEINKSRILHHPSSAVNWDG